MAKAQDTQSELEPLAAVQAFADAVLEHGGDSYGSGHTSLFVNGVNAQTCEPVTWVKDGRAYIFSNFAGQQNLLRTLVGLTELTADPRYRDAAEAATREMFDRYVGQTGLLYWGGHVIVDLQTDEVVRTLDHKAGYHELKSHFPYYRFWNEVDQSATAAFIRAFWNAHILDWSTLDMNRHGRYDQPLGELWSHTFATPPPFFEGDGLTFISSATDLIYAAGMLHQFTGDTQALDWAKRLAKAYVDARHPDTGLGAFQYSKPRKKRELPEDVISLRQELSGGGRPYMTALYGDRARNQFSPEYGEVAKEGWVLFDNIPRQIYVNNALVQLDLAETLGPDGESLLDWTVDGLKAFARYGYEASTNRFRPMWADGQDLTGKTFPRDGYYGVEGKPFDGEPADEAFALVYARAYRLTHDPALWETLRQITRNLQWGDIGSAPGEDLSLNIPASAANPMAIFTLIEIARSGPVHTAYLEAADQIAQVLILEQFDGRFFRPTPQHKYANFDTPVPLALLALEAAKRGRPEAVATYNHGEGFFQARHDGYGRTRDTRVFWAKKFDNP